MISKLIDEDALDFLMTSEFEDYTPKEYKEMLLKYRYFYRVLYSKVERLREEKEYQFDNMSSALSKEQMKVLSLQVSCVQKDEEINKLKNRRLTWKERFSGKIIHNNEDKRV